MIQLCAPRFVVIYFGFGVYITLHHLAVFGAIQVHFSGFGLHFDVYCMRASWSWYLSVKTIFKANTLSSALIACLPCLSTRWVWMCARMHQPPPSHERARLSHNKICWATDRLDARPLNMTTILHSPTKKIRTKKTQRDLCLFLTFASLYVSLSLSLFHSFRIYSRCDLNSCWM